MLTQGVFVQAGVTSSILVEKVTFQIRVSALIII